MSDLVVCLQQQQLSRENLLEVGHHLSLGLGCHLFRVAVSSGSCLTRSFVHLLGLFTRGNRLCCRSYQWLISFVHPVGGSCRLDVIFPSGV